MIHATAFLCALSIAPVDCDRSNAVDVIPLGESANEFMCMFESQVTLAQLAIRADADHRWIVRCGNRTFGGEHVG